MIGVENSRHSLNQSDAKLNQKALSLDSKAYQSCLLVFIWMVTHKSFIQLLKSLNHFAQRNKQHQMKLLLRNFHLIGNTPA